MNDFVIRVKIKEGDNKIYMIGLSYLSKKVVYIDCSADQFL